MTDIVERLRSLVEVDASELMFEAADEIERLRAQLLTWRDTHPIIVEARNDALEEAAKVADARRPQNSHRHSSQYAEMSDVIARDIATAIRAMKEQK